MVKRIASILALPIIVSCAAPVNLGFERGKHGLWIPVAGDVKREYTDHEVRTMHLGILSAYQCLSEDSPPYQGEWSRKEPGK